MCFIIVFLKGRRNKKNKLNNMRILNIFHVSLIEHYLCLIVVIFLYCIHKIIAILANGTGSCVNALFNKRKSVHCIGFCELLC